MVFISAAGAQQVHLLLKGYWKGKQKAEATILQRSVFAIQVAPASGGIEYTFGGMFARPDVRATPLVIEWMDSNVTAYVT